MKYAAFIHYSNHDKIQETRPSHREYLAGLKASGKVFASGPFTDDSGALIIYEAESEAEARSLIERDPFNTAGVFHKIDLKQWRHVV